jgi:hypothetical protein
MALKKTQAIKKCFCCGGTKLTHVDIDPETIDLTSDSVHFITGYHCEDCGNISHTDGNEVSFTITSISNPDITKLSEDNVSESWWPSHCNDPRCEKV